MQRLATCVNTALDTRLEIIPIPLLMRAIPPPTPHIHTEVELCQIMN